MQSLAEERLGPVSTLSVRRERRSRRLCRGEPVASGQVDHVDALDQPRDGTGDGLVQPAHRL